jgi:hypothetical protein
MALLVLGIFILYLLSGLILPQHGRYYLLDQTGRSPILVQLIKTFRLFEPFETPLFFILCAVLALTLVFCTYRRIHSLDPRADPGPKPMTLREIQENPGRDALILHLSPTKNNLARLIKSSGFRLSEITEDDRQVCGVADWGLTPTLGTIVAHAGMFLLIAGLFVNYLTAHGGEVTVFENRPVLIPIHSLETRWNRAFGPAAGLRSEIRSARYEAEALAWDLITSGELDATRLLRAQPAILHYGKLVKSKIPKALQAKSFLLPGAESQAKMLRNQLLPFIVSAAETPEDIHFHATLDREIKELGLTRDIFRELKRSLAAVSRLERSAVTFSEKFSPPEAIAPADLAAWKDGLLEYREKADALHALLNRLGEALAIPPDAKLRLGLLSASYTYARLLKIQPDPWSVEGSAGERLRKRFRGSWFHLSRLDGWVFGAPGTAKEGLLIRKVVPQSEAMELGLKPGDVLLDLAGRKVSSPEEVRSILSRIRPGKEVRLTIARDDEKIEIRWASRPKPAGYIFREPPLPYLPGEIVGCRAKLTAPKGPRETEDLLLESDRPVRVEGLDIFLKEPLCRVRFRLRGTLEPIVATEGKPFSLPGSPERFVVAQLVAGHLHRMHGPARRLKPSFLLNRISRDGSIDATWLAGVGTKLSIKGREIFPEKILYGARLAYRKDPLLRILWVPALMLLTGLCLGAYTSWYRLFFAVEKGKMKEISVCFVLEKKGFFASRNRVIQAVRKITG